MPFYSRKSPRIPNYDYSRKNYYFITICTHHKKCLFGNVDAHSPIGKIVQDHIEQIATHYQSVKVDKYVIMPNHIHVILCLNCDRQIDIEQVVGQFKAGVTRDIRKCYPELEIWQRSFHDHVIRSQGDHERIWLYIEGNPQRWAEDCSFVE